MCRSVLAQGPNRQPRLNHVTQGGCRSQEVNGGAGVAALCYSFTFLCPLGSHSRPAMFSMEPSIDVFNIIPHRCFSTSMLRPESLDAVQGVQGGLRNWGLPQD